MVMLNFWLNKLSKLRVDRASEHPAPHKPLLLLAIIDQIEDSSLSSTTVSLTPELAFRFLSYWEIVSHRGRSAGRVELPFYYLQSDGFLKHIAIQGLDAALGSIRPTSVDSLNKVILHSELAVDFFTLMQAADARDAARKVLISGNWFSAEEKARLSALLDMDIKLLDGDEPQDFSAHLSENIKRGRDIKFRLQIVPMYHYACVLCTSKMLLPSGITLVEAAHIHQFAHSKNDDVSNGMALCRNHHWAFDQGLWTIGMNYEVMVARNKFVESAPHSTELTSYQSKRLDFSWLKSDYQPSQTHLNWHRQHKFIGEKL
jgi:putative restriction endonuclease